MEEKPKEAKTRITGFASITEDLILNILKRLPALSFSSAACVSKSWNQICNQILSKPKLTSAFSLNQDEKVALEVVVNKVLSEPIRPHFAIANVIGYEVDVDLGESLNFFMRQLASKLGSTTPIIVSRAHGIMGRNATTNEFREVMVDDFSDGESNSVSGDGESNSGFGVMLTVGFLPGLKVDAIPLLRPRKARRGVMVDSFVMDIKNYAASVSGSTSPVAIIMFGADSGDQKPVMEKLDHAMSRETIIVGDERAQFLYRSSMESRNVYGSEYFFDGVALIFARDQNKPRGLGEIHFHAALSTGVSAIGPRYRAVSVKEIGKHHESRDTWLTARREGEQEILDGQTILNDINDEFENQIGCPDLYIGVTKQRKCFVGSDKSRLMTFLVFHEIRGGNEEYLFANGAGIKSGDYFQFYHSDPTIASSSCSKVSENLRNLKVNKETVGGFIFSCCGRGRSFFECSNVDSSPFLENFPGVPVSGLFCGGEIGRWSSTSNVHEAQTKGTAHCSLHVYSTIYLVVSFTPAPPEH